MILPKKKEKRMALLEDIRFISSSCDREHDEWIVITTIGDYHHHHHYSQLTLAHTSIASAHNREFINAKAE